jgi:hypothetical protein
MKHPNIIRRNFLRLAGLFGIGMAAKAAHAHHTETHFEDSSPHKLVYQCNSADHEYLDHILFSCGEMLRKYGDDIELVVAVFGPGIHLLAKRPGRGVSRRQQQRAGSLSDYGVAFHACGNTMKALDWKEDDMLEFTRIVPVGVDDIMQLQEKGFAYMSW